MNLKPEQERLGQYATRDSARAHARMETICTGRKHVVVHTSTERGEETLFCWTVLLTKTRKESTK